MLLTKETTIKPSSSSIQYYSNLGYDVKWHKPLTVRVEDLPPNSSALVDAECDYCGKIKKQMRYSTYNRITKNGTVEYCCSDCSHIKQRGTMMERYGCKTPIQNPEIKQRIQETNLQKYGSVSPAGNKEVREKQKQTNLERYGVENPLASEKIKEKVKQTNLKRYGVENAFQSKEIQEKAKQTNLERYGVENVLYNDEIISRRNTTLMERFGTLYPLQNEECYEKLKQTNLERYGVEHVSQLDEVKDKVKQTNLERYGVEYSSQNEEVKRKIEETNIKKYGVKSLLCLPEFHQHSREVDMERYGVYHHFQNPEILAKQKDTLYKNRTCPASKQQVYICNLYNGEINFPLKMYSVDICLPEEKIVIEYDGGGHDLGIKLGTCTQEEFAQKEIIRNNVIKREGYKQMRIISVKDLLPSDDILLQMLSDAKQYFSDYPNHSWINFDIDKSIVRNAENKDGIPYDFGKLRKIRKSDVEDIEENVA